MNTTDKYALFVKQLILEPIPSIENTSNDYTLGSKPLTTKQKEKIYKEYCSWDGIGEPKDTIWQWEDKADAKENIPAVKNFIYMNACDYKGKELSVFDFLLRLHLYDTYEKEKECFELEPAHVPNMLAKGFKKYWDYAKWRNKASR